MFHSSSSSPSSGRRHRLGLTLAAVFSILASGCFNAPKIDPTQTRHCKDDKSCPWGSVCGANGICCESADGKTCKVPPSSGGVDALAIDSSPVYDIAIREDGTGSAPGLDGSIDAPPSEGGSGPETAGTESETGVVGRETASTDSLPDLPQPMEAPPADGPTDAIPSPPPDRGPDYPADLPVAPDMGPDVGPDLPYVPEVGPDLPLTSCMIGGTSYASGAANPANTCQVCKPATLSSAWSNADEGTSCGSGQYCDSGACKAGCFISGAYYANAAANPANACQTCQTTFATTAWTASASGASCGTGQVCSAGTCQGGCWIAGALVGSGTTNASNVCQICKPTSSTSGWSSNTDGTSCGTGKICGAGTCQIGCYMGATVYATGALNPANGCQSCSPSISTSTWYQVPSDCATIAAHDGFTCATTGGGAKCWGSNGYGVPGGTICGFLGIGQTCDQTSQSAVPVAVSGLSSGVQAISTGSGSQYSCAVVNGAVKCWGAGAQGSLGNGAADDANAPVQVAGLTSGAQGVATGGRHSCAIVSGQVYCWGSNSNGLLGLDPNSSSGSTTPVSISLVGNTQAIAVGGSHTCVLNGGSVSCWGFNGFGQLGNNTTTDSYIPVQPVGFGSNVEAIASGGNHTCAIANGGLLCWGSNSSGQLGDGTTTDRWAPVPVQGLSGVQAVSAGDQHTCAIVNGGAWCWGANGHGALGDNSTANRYSPVTVQGLGSGVQAIAAGGIHTCALTSAGAKCWGYNGHGELGNNSTTNSSIPVSVQGL